MSTDYQLSPEALASIESSKESNKSSSPPQEDVSVFRKAEDVVSSMLAKGFILGKDAIAKAKSLDEKHQLTSTASAKVTSFDKKIGFTDKINTGTTVVSEKVKEVDQKFQVSEKTKSAIAAAEQTMSNAGSTIMKNRYVLTGTTWVSGAYSKVSKAAEEVGQMAKEKAGLVEEEEEKKKKVVDDVEVANVPLSHSPKVLDKSEQDSKLSVSQPQTLEPQEQGKKKKVVDDEEASVHVPVSPKGLDQSEQGLKASESQPQTLEPLQSQKLESVKPQTLEPVKPQQHEETTPSVTSGKA